MTEFVLPVVQEDEKEHGAVGGAEPKAEVQWPDGAPGSDEAFASGCRCPVYDNAHGRGAYALGKSWWMVEDCPLHGYRTAAAISVIDHIEEDANAE